VYDFVLLSFSFQYSFFILYSWCFHTIMWANSFLVISVWVQNASSTWCPSLYQDLGNFQPLFYCIICFLCL
jgi:hypothetical protein